jgi:hypothetical protein
MTSNARRVLSFLALSVVGSSGCQPTAGVKIAFDNRNAGAITQSLTAADGQTPSVFGIHLVAAYLAEDQDGKMDNVGEVGRIWTNPICDPDLYRCGISPKAGPYRVTEYFDLALPTEEVNARLNAQEHTIKPGTYRLLRLDMAGVLDPSEASDPGLPNMRYGMAGETPSEVRRTNVHVVKLDPPIELAEGDTVTLSLGYDIRDSYFAGPEVDESHPPEGISFNDWICGDHSRNPVGGPCLKFKGFAPSVTRTAAAR